MDPFFRFGSRCRSNFCLPEQKKMFSSFSLFFPKCWLISPTFLHFMSITVANLMCFFFHMVRDWGRERLTLLWFLRPPCGRVCRYWIDYTQAKNAGQKAHYKTFLFRSKKKEWQLRHMFHRSIVSYCDSSRKFLRPFSPKWRKRSIFH